MLLVRLAARRRVDHEFEPFVVGCAETAVRQRLAQQFRSAKRITQQWLGHPVLRNSAYRDAEASNSSTRLTLPTRCSRFSQAADAVVTFPLRVTSMSLACTE